MRLLNMPWLRHERFNRAVETAAGYAGDVTRGAVGGALTGMPEWGGDLAAELAVVRCLRRTAPSIGPGDAARERMRQQVLAALTSAPEQLATEVGAGARLSDPTPITPISQITPVTLRSGDRASRRRPARPHRPHANGLLIALAAAACVIVVCGAITVTLSRSALPGQALYGVRRTAESATIGLTFDHASQGYEHLEYAADRVSDLEALTTKQDRGGDSSNQFLIALADFDAEATAGSVALTSLSAGTAQGSLGTLRDWSSREIDQLGRVAPRLPAGARARADASLALLHRILGRAGDLLARISCDTVTLNSSDALGPLPAVGACDHHDGAGSPTGTSSRSAPHNGTTPRTISPAPPESATTGPADPSAGSGLGLTVPPLLPGLPSVRIGG